MNALDIIRDLRNKGVRFRAVGDRLDIQAPKGTITPELKEVLVQKKQTILELLSQEEYEQVRFSKLSEGQKALWYLHKLAPQSHAYNVAFAARIHSHLDKPALRRALQCLVNRHAILRTTYCTQHGEPAQRIHAQQEICIKEINVTQMQTDEIDQKLLAEYREPFDLEDGPLFRAVLFYERENRHILLINIHHIAIDGWSLWMLLDELSKIYQAEAGGISINLDTPECEYTDFVDWQSDWLGSSQGDAQWEYWQKQLEDAPNILEIPTDRPRPNIQTYNGASYPYELKAEVANQVYEFCRYEGVTPYVVMMTAFQTLLYRYARQQDFVIGSPIAGRTKQEFAQTVGYFVNPVVIRAKLDDRLSLQDLLQNVRQNTLEALEHQAYPFPLLVEQLDIPRDKSRSPLFQIDFVLQNMQRMGPMARSLVLGGNGTWLDFGGLKIEPMALGQQEGLYDLRLEVVQTAESFILNFKYNTDLFTEEFISRLSVHYRSVLSQLLVDDLRVGDVELLSGNERQLVLEDWNATSTTYAESAALHSKFEQCVAQHPSHCALLWENGSFSYEELNRHSNRLAHALREQGIGPDCGVGVCAERSPEMVIALLGILKAGGAYVPLEPTYPLARLRDMIEDAGLKVVLAQERFTELVSGCGASVLRLDNAHKRWTDLPDSNPNIPLSGSNVAYVIYTSGSTGKPKGVMVPHAGIINRLEWMQEAYGLTEADTVLQKTPYSFDVSVWEFFWPLREGARLIVARPGGHRDSSYLAALIESQKVTTLHFVPSMLRVFLDEENLEQRCNCVQRVICSGEALSTELARLHASRWGAPLYNLYGPTEVSVDVTWQEYVEDSNLGGTIPIGRPIANTQTYVLDEQLRPVPIGVLGELYLGGIGLARGYANRPDLTAERFVPHPFGQHGERLYRTGDLVRWLPEGVLEYAGRTDGQVKVRGNRLELGEIEAVLDRCPQVAASVVTAHQLDQDDVRLAGYVVPTNDWDEAAVREVLRQQLPDFMMPSVFMVLDELPLNPNGKVDRKALPEPVWGIQNKDRYVAPSDPVEELLCGIWSEILGTPRVGVEDDFFAAGGHSLLATRVISRIRDVFGVEFPLSRFFEEPTVRGLAARMPGESDREDIPVLQRVERDGLLPLSFAQERLWFLHQLDASSTAYNMTGALRLRGVLNVEALERSFQTLLQRHEILRTRFVAVEGTPKQKIEETIPFTFERIVLNGKPNDLESALQEIIRDESNKPFDLNRTPLIRATIIALGDDENVLLLSMHHIIFDGWSVSILLDEISKLYAAYCGEDQTPDLVTRSLDIQYADYAIWQRTLPNQEHYKKQIEYWQHRLNSLQPLQFPTDHPRPPIQTGHASETSFQISTETSQKLEQLCEREGITSFMFFAACLNTLLYRYTQQEDITIGFPIAGRSHSDLESIIGCFINSLVLRTELSDRTTVRSLLQQIRKHTLEAYDHQDAPFEKIVERLQPDRDRSRSPLFQVMLTAQDNAINTFHLPGIDTEPIQIEITSTKYDLTFHISKSETGFKGILEFSLDLFSEKTAQRLASHFQRLLEALLTHPDMRLVDLPLLEEEEKSQLFQWSSSINSEQTAFNPIIHTFENTVQKYPSKIALSCTDRHIRYDELNASANRLAHRLQKMGVKRETPVAICASRSPELIIGVLAILKAGGAYIPLDPSHPPERLNYMLQDAGASVLLAHRHYLPQFKDSGAQIFLLDEIKAETKAETDENLHIPIAPNDLAYVIYTSGSTGLPKGCQIEHRSLAHYIHWVNDYYFKNNDAGDFFFYSSLSFDLTVTSLFSSLLRGRTLHICSNDHDISHGLQCAFRKNSGIDVIKITPAHIQLLGHLDIHETSIKVAIVGGEAFARKQIQILERLNPEMEIYNEYGPTESTVGCIVKRVSSNDPIVLIGKPIENTEAFILDANQELLPQGIPGELYLGGAGLARGYLNRPEATAKAFIPHPYRENERLYRTGDIARWTEEGEIEYIGRNDGQIKIRGHRIEIGEIESVLTSQPGVSACAVVSHKNSNDDLRLVAYLVLDSGTSSDTVRDAIRDRLPEYMAPSEFIEMDSLPFTVNGKVDRNALLEPKDKLQTSREYIAPRNPTDEILAGFWSEILECNRIGIADNFFDLGGHSLLAARLLSRIRRTFQIDLPLDVLFEAQTIEALSAKITGVLKEDLSTKLPPITRVKPTESILASSAQQRLWFHQQMKPDSPAYHLPAAFKITGALDISAFEHSIQKIGVRHNALRTNLYSENGQLYQRVNNDRIIELKIENLQKLNKAEKQSRLEAYIAEQSRRPFDLMHDSLMRCMLLQTDTEEFYFLITLHHIVADGWSIDIFTRELYELYKQHTSESKADLPILPIQYADFSSWENSWIESEAVEKHLAYWVDQLEGVQTLELPTVQPRPAQQNYNGRRYSFSIESEQSDKLKEFSRKQDCTLFMAMLSAFEVLLHRYAGQEDFAIGSPSANRNRHETENLIGFFVNTLVLRSDLQGNPELSELIRRVRKTVLDAHAHQDAPFERIVNALHVQRDPSRSPLFQVMFAMQQDAQQDISLPGLQIENLDVDNKTSKFDLTLFITESPQGLSASFEYNTDLFTEEFISRLSVHYRSVLSQLLVGGDLRVGDVELLSGAERQLVLKDWNATSVTYAESTALHSKFEQCVAQHPSRCALAWENGSFSYEELNRHSNRLAHALREQGIGPDCGVGVCAERSPEMVIALLGILKAGGAYVPLEPTYPLARLRDMIEDAGLKVVLAQERFTELVSGCGASVLRLDNTHERWTDLPDYNPDIPLSGSNTAYVIYTSGSTGKPKGVMVPHAGIINRLEWMQEAYGLTEADTVLQKTPYSFDVSVWEFFWPLREGARLVVARPGGHRDSSYLASLIESQQVTTLHFVPSMLRVFLDEENLEERCNCVQRVICSGEALSTELARLHASRWGAPLYNLYGPTEVSVDVTWQEYVETPALGGTIPIGRPIANTQTYVLDEQLRPVPIGVLGELYLGGIGLARGYANRPDLTAERFVPHPFGQHGERLYRTGDLVRWLPDGALEYAGRTDGQVKVRGNRLELGEIEAVLDRCPHVSASVVTAHQFDQDDVRLAGYVVPTNDWDEAAVREFLRQQLPDFMMPSVFVVLDDLPLNPNGKVDRKALPEPVWGIQNKDRYVAPSSPVEELLCGIWSEVLGTPRVGTEDDFFAAGGHSLLATRVISRIRDVFGVEFPLSRFFEEPTVRGLAARMPGESDREDIPVLQRVERDGLLPLSFAQERLWFLHQLDASSTAYNMTGALRLRGALDVEALERSFQTLIQRHEILRTRFVAVEGKPFQEILAPDAVALSFTVESVSESGLQEQLAIDAEQPFDVQQAPLLRVRCFKIAKDDYVLAVTMHHLISDGWSVGIFLRELGSLYSGEEGNTPDLQYADYASWQKEWLSDTELNQPLSYWRKTLANCAVLDLPTDFARPAVQGFEGGQCVLEVSSEIRERVEELSRSEGVTPFMTLLASFQVMLARYSGQDDIVVGTPVAGRSVAGLEGMLGCFVNDLVLRTELSKGLGFRTLLERVRETALGAYRHQDVPFERLVEVLHPDRELSRSPLFQVMFALQNATGDGWCFEGLETESVGIERNAVPFDLTLEIEEQDAGYRAVWSYRCDLFKPETAERMAKHWLRLLEAVLQSCDEDIWRLPLLGDSERRMLLEDWNATGAAHDDKGLVHGLIEEQAKVHPQQIAVRYADTQLTYAELNIEANRIAHYLATLGVGPETVVALAFERGTAMVAAMLGVMKAGAAYLPLDPALPDERLAYMLKDAGVRVVLTGSSLQDRFADKQEGKREPNEYTVIILDHIRDILDQQPQHNPQINIHPRNLAYVIYTSGSTGKPKGVQIEHKGLVNLARAQAESFHVDSTDNVLQFASFGFDASVSEILVTLAAGATLCLAAREDLLPGPDLLRILSEYEISAVTLPPAALSVLNPSDITQLQTIVSAGEACPLETAHRWSHNRSFINAYGPTECTVCATLTECNPEIERISIGKPISNISTYILNESLEPVPIGVDGQLFIGGIGVGRGYLGQPEKTAEVFMPDPFSTMPGMRMYATGDRVRWQNDGNIEFRGRVDRQIKLRGYRIEPGEIEKILTGVPEIAEAIITDHKDEVGNPRLVGYIRLENTNEITADHLRARLKSQLPDYMIPSSFVFIERFPLTSSGKIDLRSLPAPVSTASVQDSEYVAPVSDREKELASIWSAVLGIENVGIYDNFFSLGGESILSMQIVDRVRRLGYEITPKQIFQYQTIAELAPQLRQSREFASHTEPDKTNIIPTPIFRWFFERGLDNPHHFNQSIALRIQRPLDAHRLQKAINQITQHHPMLRARFDGLSNGDISILTLPEGAIELQQYAHEGDTQNSWRDALENIGGKLHRQINIANGPVFAAALVSWPAKDEYRLLLTAHHLIVDGVSWRILVEDIQSAYEQLEKGSDGCLHRSATTFASWSHALCRYANSETIRADSVYWQELSQQKQHRLPVDQPNGENTEATEDTKTFILNLDQTQHLLQHVQKRSKAHVDELLLAALLRAVSQWSETFELWIDIEGHGREDIGDGIDTTRTVGWFTNLFPAYFHLQSQTGSLENLKSIKEQIRKIPRRGFSYGLNRYLSDCGEIRQKLSALPQPDISFNYFGRIDGKSGANSLFEVTDEPTGPPRDPHALRSHELAVNAAVLQGCLQINFSYSKARYHQETIARLSTLFSSEINTFQELGNNGSLPIATPSDFPLANINQKSLDRLLESFGDIEDIYPLTPLQQGMLFENRRHTESRRSFEHVACTFSGDLDVGAFKKAWQFTAAQNAVLRTAFVWDSLERPLQVVLPSIDIQLNVLDWRDIPESAQEQKIASFMKEDRSQGFDFNKAPLFRLTLIQLDRNVYRFIWSHDHLILDGWSLPLLLSQVFENYNRYHPGKEGSPSSHTPFRNYIEWLQDRDSEKAKEFWRKEFQGFDSPALLSKHESQPAKENLNKEPQCFEIQLPREQTQTLQSFVKQNQLTLSSVFQGLWALVLSRHCGMKDVAIGVTVAGRPSDLPRSHNIIGLFINTLPLRIPLHDDLDLCAWLRGVRDRTSEIREHEYSLLPEVQQWSGIGHDHTLFDSIVVFENYPVDAFTGKQLTGIEISDIQTVEDTHFPLTLVIAPHDSISIKFLFDDAFFSPEEISRLSTHYRSVLSQLLVGDGLRVGDVELLSGAERQLVLEDWNATSTTYAESAALHSKFEQCVAQHPSHCALLWENGSFSYEELNRHSNRLAHALREQGIGPDCGVGVCAERSPEMVIALLGILKAGGAYVPLEPTYPPARLRDMIEDAGLKVVLAQERFTELVSGCGASVLTLDNAQERWTNLPDDNPDIPLSGSNTAYVIYTSGSTGKPKGVMVPHAGIINRLEWMQEAYGLTEADTVLQKTPYSFDVSVWEFFWPLREGARLVVARPGGHRDSSYLASLIESQQVTTLHFVPSMLRVFLDEENLEERCNCVQRVICSGEALSTELARLHASRWGAPLYNLYGPTEVSVDVTWQEYVETPALGGTIPIGRPIANTQTYVLDEQLRPVPIGVLGELYLGGIGLARGYANRPDLTAERFVPHPFGQHGERLYRTGDLVRWLPDGALEYAGRTDGQVKVRGNRLELGEIEAVLDRCPHVSASVVTAHQFDQDDVRLAGYVVPTNDWDEAAVREFLRQQLPDFMMPSVFVVLDDLPLNPNGKVDRKALPEPVWGIQNKDRYVAPSSPVEELLCGIWSEVLGTPRVGTEDDFFAAGGHSLLATRVISRIRDVFGVEFPLSRFFEEPTVRGLAARMPGESDREDIPVLQRVERDGLLPLSFAQERLWFLHQLDASSTAYNMTGALRLRGALDVEALERSFQTLIQRHEILRTRFVAVEGKPFQEILAPDAVALSFTVESVSESGLQEQLAIDAEQPFDVQQAPLLRVRCFKIAKDDYVLAVTMHHLISDGWSVGIFLRELGSLYSGEEGNTPDLQYADYASWQKEWLSDTELNQPLSYWRKTLANCAVLDLPTDFARPAVQGFEGGQCVLEVSSEIRERVEELSRSEGVTPFMTLLASFQVMLARYSGQDDIVVGTPVAGRSVAGLEGMLGCFVNDLVLRTELSKGLGFRTLLERVRETALGAYRHQDVPFERLVEVLHPDRELSRSPLFQVMFALQNATGDGWCFEGLETESVGIERNAVPFDLTLEIEEQDAGYRAVWSYRCDLFKPETAERMAKHWLRLLEAVLQSCDEDIWRLPLLGDSERRMLLEDWNATGAAHDDKGLVHGLIEEQAKVHPQQIAVRYADTQLTYAELNIEANRIAHYLATLGVGPETVVALAFERGTAMVAAMLGVMKAGAAYLPLDPALPDERLAYMLKDAGVRVVLTGSSLQDRFADKQEGKREPNEYTVIILDHIRDILDQQPQHNPQINIHPRNLAYVIYTSGSTGKPKGVGCTHDGAINFLEDFAQRKPLSAGDPCSVWTSYSFDVSVYEIFTALTSGGTVDIVPEEIRLETEIFFEWLKTRGIRSAYIPPFMLAGLAEWLESEENDLALRRLLVGVEPIPESVLVRLRQLLPELFIINGYGPTEATICSTLYDVPSDLHTNRRTPLGKPLQNLQIYLLDEYLDPVPVDLPGELYVGGTNLARGYINQPALTAERFIPNPFSTVPGERLYRTGDLARYLSDGNLEFIGRADDQVKLRGYRIELSEIESVLLGHPDIGEAVVLAREDFPGEKQLAAYISPNNGNPTDIDDIHTYLRRRLPAYMVPTALVVLERIPKTPGGKLDRQALPKPEYRVGHASATHQTPRNETENSLVKIWSEVLHLEDLGINDNFFELGGDSILIVQIVSRAKQAGLIFRAKDVFQNQTIAELARVAQTNREETPAFEDIDTTGPQPLSPVQRWFFETIQVERHHWNQAVLVQSQKKLEPKFLEQAFQALLRQHGALRTRFVEIDGEWKQIVALFSSEDIFECVNLTALSEIEARAKIETIAEEKQALLNLQNGPLIHAVYFQNNPSQNDRLLVIIHHLAIDGVSWRILFEDLLAAYRDLESGREIKPQPVSIPFHAWVRRLEQFAQTETLKAEADYWLEMAATKSIMLPIDFKGGDNTFASMGRITRTLPQDLTQNLIHDVHSAYGTQINDFLLTALARAFHSWTGIASLRLDIEGHGREELFNDADISKTVGWFTTVYPLHLRLENKGQSGPALKSIKEQLRNVPNHGIGFGLLKYLCRDPKLSEKFASISRQEVSFNYLGRLDQALAGESIFAPANESRGNLYAPQGESPYRLTINCSVIQNQLQVDWDFSEKLFHTETIERVADAYIEALRTLINDIFTGKSEGYTPSDFPEADLSQDELDGLVADILGDG